jgi:NAD(P) transhydrogenase subunit beta
MTGAELRDTAVALSYIVATLLFIIGLRQLSSPRTARAGNRMAGMGMLVALVATLVHKDVVSYWTIALALPLGAVFGIVSARRVAMTAMPQMVALFNGAGGATAALVSVAEYVRAVREPSVSIGMSLSVALGTAIGAVSLSGSLIAFLKLQELMSSAPFQPRLMRGLNLVLAIALVGLGWSLVAGGGMPMLWAILALSLVLGATGTLPIGGGDMPVVIAIVNSLTGLATAVTGLVLDNEMLIVAGMLVGASGTLLTLLMSKAMNRSIASVLFGGFGAPVAAKGGAAGPTGDPRTISVEDLAVTLAYARRVAIIPGYGLAVAQAQREVQTIANDLVARGVDVVFAIHPVAGRMPGHMNVLLAEANVPYERMIELEQANADFGHTDVALIVGANDVVNPAAREDPSSPIYGMPILDADRAKLAVILKRGRSAGFAGIDNALFYREASRMLYGDAKSSLAAIAEALKTA